MVGGGVVLDDADNGRPTPAWPAQHPRLRAFGDGLGLRPTSERSAGAQPA